MFLVVANFEHDGVAFKHGDKYDGKDANLLLAKKLIAPMAKKEEPKPKKKAKAKKDK